MKNAPPSPATPALNAPAFQITKGTLLQAAALFLLVLIAFAPAFRAQFIWDDDMHVTLNRYLRNLPGLYQLWFNPKAYQQYYPLAQTSWWIDYHLWGLDPLGYHVVNILLHAGSVLLLWRILARMQVPGAWWGAALFAVHPMQVETVAWIMERKNLLSGFFELLACYCLLPAFSLEDDPPPRSKNRLIALYIAGIFSFVCALLGKSVASSLPPVILLLIWWKRGRWTAREWLLSIPLFIFGLTSGLATAYLERTQVYASGPEFAFSPADRLLIAGRALWHYLTHLLWPYPLMFFYPRWDIDAAVLWQYLYPLTFAAFLVVLFLYRNKIGRGPLAAMLLFAGVLFPALGFVNVYPMRFSFVADHFQYMACIGPFALAAAIVASHVQRGSAAISRMAPTLAMIVGGLVLTLLAAATFERSRVFYDGITLYSDLIAKNPTHWMGHNLLGVRYFETGQFEAAVEQWAAATQCAPEESENWEGLGNSLRYAGRLNEALEMLKKAVDMHPNSERALSDLAAAYQILNQPQKAAELYHAAITINPNFGVAHYNLGNMLAHAGNFAAAAEEYRIAVALWSQGIGAEAEIPKGGEGLPDALFKLALCLAELNRLPEALPYFEQAVSLRPNWPEAQNDLARARASLGK